MREALLLVVAGLAIGVPIAFGGAHLVAKLEDPHIYSSLLFHLGPDDPISMIAAIIVMLVVAVAAGYFPARRASTTDPMVALRYE
jgi:ABC-type antimicrobial peptide transport system permease subunit